MFMKHSFPPSSSYREYAWPLTLKFHLLTWILHVIGVIFSSRTIYLPSLKLLGQSVLEYWVAQGVGDQHDLWLLTFFFDLLTWISIGIIYWSRTIYLLSLKLLGQCILELSVAQGVGDQHDLWPTDLNINKDHLLVKNYLASKFEASETVFLSYQLHKVKGDRHSDQSTYMCKAICSSFFEGGRGIWKHLLPTSLFCTAFCVHFTVYLFWRTCIEYPVVCRTDRGCKVYGGGGGGRTGPFTFQHFCSRVQNILWCAGLTVSVKVYGGGGAHQVRSFQHFCSRVQNILWGAGLTVSVKVYGGGGHTRCVVFSISVLEYRISCGVPGWPWVLKYMGGGRIGAYTFQHTCSSVQNILWGAGLTVSVEYVLLRIGCQGRGMGIWK